MYYYLHYVNVSIHCKGCVHLMSHSGTHRFVEKQSSPQAN